MNKQERALERIRTAQQAAEEELSRHHAGNGTVGSVAQLKAVCDALTAMQQLVVAGKLPPPSERDRGMGRMIVDAWPMESSLGDLVLEAEQAFLKL